MAAAPRRPRRAILLTCSFASLPLALAEVRGVVEAGGGVDALVLRATRLHRLDGQLELADVALDLRRATREAHEWRAGQKRAARVALMCG